jgi:hypothetical protein
MEAALLRHAPDRVTAPTFCVIANFQEHGELQVEDTLCALPGELGCRVRLELHGCPLASMFKRGWRRIGGEIHARALWIMLP